MDRIKTATKEICEHMFEMEMESGSPENTLEYLELEEIKVKLQIYVKKYSK